MFEEVRDEGQKCISTRWVYTFKDSPTGPLSKAQLEAQSFEELEVSELQKDSPTCATESLRLLVTVISQRQWTPNSIDLKSAFLQGMQLSCDIYIRPPPKADSRGTLWKLNKCVYGLADASLYWYNRVRNTQEKRKSLSTSNFSIGYTKTVLLSGFWLVIWMTLYGEAQKVSPQQ